MHLIRKCLAAHVFVISVSVLPASAQQIANDQADLFRSEVAGLELRKPRSWRFQNLEVIARHRAAAKLKDQELQEKMQQLASAPLVIATKYDEPFANLNPSFQVIIRPLGQLSGISPEKLLDLTLPGLQKTYADYTVVEKIAGFEVGGFPAARLTGRYTVGTRDGKSFPTKGTIVLIPKGSYLYMLGFSGPPDGPDALTEEIGAVLNSVRFLH